MKVRRFYIATIIMLLIVLVASNLYQWNRQNKIKENVEELINQRLSMLYHAVNWELTPETDVRVMPDLLQDLEVFNYLTGIYGQFLGNSERDKDIASGINNLTYMLGDYTTVYYVINEGLPYNQSKELLQSMNAYFVLVGDIANVTQHDLEERLLAFYNAESDKEMIDRYGSLSELRSEVNRVSGIYKNETA